LHIPTVTAAIHVSAAFSLLKSKERWSRNAQKNLHKNEQHCSHGE